MQEEWNKRNQEKQAQIFGDAHFGVLSKQEKIYMNLAHWKM